MPSSGYGITDVIKADDPKEHYTRAKAITEAAQIALGMGMFVEWLESFVAAFQQGADAYECASAGLIEWDM